jgi:EmrB/QacA subfamily drug resistance transporter
MQHTGEPVHPSRATQQWTLVATILASGIVFLDSTVVNLALPSIDRQLDAGLSGLQWIVDGYLVTLAALLILGGSLGDRYGRRRVMLIGLVVFGLASLACGLAPSLAWLVAARLLQGVGGALMVPGSLAILRATFPQGEARGKAIGQWSGWSGITTVVGPLLGGWLVDALSWRYIFFINVPIVALALFLLARRVPESRDTTRAAPDWLGAATITVALGGLAYGLIEGPVAGWGSPLVAGGLAAGIVALGLFLLVEARVREPMLPLALFRSRNFAAANLTTVGVYFSLYGSTFFLVIYVQNVMGYPALIAGLILAPLTLLLLLLSPLVGRLAGRRGSGVFMAAGGMLCALGLLALTRLEPGSSFWTGLLPPLLIFGLGLSCTVAPLTNTVVSSVPGGHAGLAAAFNNAVSRVAALLAIALLGIVVSLTFRSELEERVAGLSLPAGAQAALQAAAESPTGAADVASLPAEARVAVDQAYTAAFRRAMLVAALAAALGGAAALIMVRQLAGERDQDRDVTASALKRIPSDQSRSGEIPLQKG